MAKYGAILTNKWRALLVALILVAGIGTATYMRISTVPTASNFTQTSAQTRSAPAHTANPSPASSNLHPIPLYTPSKLVSSTQNSATYTSASPSYTVINFYGEYLSTDGWKITSETTLNGTTTINAQGNDQAISVVMSDAPNDSTTFVIQTH